MASQDAARGDRAVPPPMQPPVQPYTFPRTMASQALGTMPLPNQPPPPPAPMPNPMPFPIQSNTYSAPAPVVGSGYQRPPAAATSSATYNYNSSSSAYQSAPQQNYNLQYQQPAFQQPSGYQSVYQPPPQQSYPSHAEVADSTDPLDPYPQNSVGYAPISSQPPATHLPYPYEAGHGDRVQYQPVGRSDDQSDYNVPVPAHDAQGHASRPEDQQGETHVRPQRPPTPRPQPEGNAPVNTGGFLEDQGSATKDPLSRVFVQDGSLKCSFATADALGRYLKLYPEADNDRGCRVFRYGPGCSTKLLIPLFERLDFSRFSQYPYGLLGNSSISDAWGSGSCTCDKCGKGQFCGHYMLHKNFKFYLAMESHTTEHPYPTPIISTAQGMTTICYGSSRHDFQHADWNLQLFRFRSRNFSTTLFAYDALVYQNYDMDVKVRSSPLDYIFHQLEHMLENWDQILQASSQFLTSFRVEVLEERLGTDRSIVRTLILAAQHWEEYRKVLKMQLVRIAFLRKVYGDPRWAEDREAQFETMATADNLVQRFEAIDFRITMELMQETDALIQRVTNLISIDEGYRSRDQNESIRRLTWITFIFLPLLFASALFSMQIDMFSTASPWQYYIYVALILMFIIFAGYAVLRSRRRVARVLGRVITFPGRVMMIAARSFMYSYKTTMQMKAAEMDIEGQQKASADEAAIILKWAASSNNLQALRSLLIWGHDGVKAPTEAYGAALVAAIQSRHTEACMLIITHKQCLPYLDRNGSTPLHWAAKCGLATICQELLAGGVSLNTRNSLGETALDWAMEEGEESTINLLLRGNKELNRLDTLNLQSIHFSARMGDLGMVKSLFKKTGTLEMRDEKGQTVLFHAVKGGQLEIVQWLLKERRANVSAVDKDGLTALHVAVQAGDEEIAKLIIEGGANTNAQSNSLIRPIHMVRGSKAKEMIKLLLKHGAQVDSETRDGTRLIHMAARQGDQGTQILQALIDEGCDLQARASGGNNAAHLAASCASTANIAALIRRSREFLTSRNALGYTPLMMAAQAGSTEVMEYLLNEGASYVVSDNDGHSLVDLTISWGDPKVMSVLISRGAQYNAVLDEAERHPVWGAVRDGQGRQTLQQLLGAGLNVDYRWNRMSLLQNALESGNTEAAKCLLEGGAMVDVKDEYGWTALHSAAFNGAVQPLLLVLQRAVNKAPRDNQGWTPLDLAAFYGHEEAVALLDPEGQVKKYAWEQDTDNLWSNHSGRVRGSASLTPVFEAPGD